LNAGRFHPIYLFVAVFTDIPRAEKKVMTFSLPPRAEKKVMTFSLLLSIMIWRP